MKITRVTIHNFLKLKDVDFNPSETNVIVGKNKQGKTSILKAIRAAFTGDVDASSIRIGETKAEITLELDELNIRRTVTEKSNYLDISNKEGMKMPAPQKFLDGVIGTFSFNPIEFFEKKLKERKEYLLNAIKITTTPEELSQFIGEPIMTGEHISFEKHALDVIADIHKWYYEQRTTANAEKVKKQKTLEDLNGQIPEGFDVSTVSEERIKSLRAVIERDKDSKRDREFINEKIAISQKNKARLEKELQDEIEMLAALDKDLAALPADGIPESVEKIVKELEALENQREFVYTVKRRDEVRGELDTAVIEADRLDRIVKALSKTVPEALIQKAELPIAGLKIVGDDILINDVSLDNLSSSEQLKFGLDIVRALNTKFKVICVDGIESLDKESFEQFLLEAEKDDYQYFVTRVEGDTAHSIVVEDGEIKSPAK